MSSDGFSCLNPLCVSGEIFPDYDAVCAHLAIPSTHCSQWAMDLVDRMTQNIPGNQDANEYDGGKTFVYQVFKNCI